MKKTILSLAVVSSLAVAGSAFAADNTTSTNNAGFYAGVNLGYAQTAKGLFADNTTIATQAVVGTDIVPVNVSTRRNSQKDHGVAGRIFGGYLFTKNFGVEAGYTKFHNAKANYTGQAITSPQAYIAAVTSNYKVTEQSFDILGVARYPFSFGLAVYAKLGAAYVQSKLSADVTTDSFDGNTPEGSATTNTTAKAKVIRPEFVLGTSYDITKAIAVDVEWSHIQGKHNAYKDNGTSFANLKNTNMYSAGVTYKF